MTLDPKCTSQPRYVRIDDRLWEAIKQEAKRGRRPVTMQLELIVVEWLEEKEGKE